MTSELDDARGGAAQHLMRRHESGAKTAIKPLDLGDLGPFGCHGFLHRWARQHAFAVLHHAWQLGRVDPVAFDPVGK